MARNEPLKVNDCRIEEQRPLSITEDERFAEEEEEEQDEQEETPSTTELAEATLAKFLVYLLSPDGGKRERKSCLQTVNEVRTVISVIGYDLRKLLDRCQSS